MKNFDNKFSNLDRVFKLLEGYKLLKLTQKEITWKFYIFFKNLICG